MNLKPLLLPLALLANLASAQLTIVLSPVAGDDEVFLIQASGTGGEVVSETDNGILVLDGIAFNLVFDTVDSGLNFGGISVTDARPSGGFSFRFDLLSSLSDGTSYSFSGGSATATLSSGVSYTSTFNVGSYLITNSNGVFGNGTTGTFEILSSPIPEHSAFPFLAGLCALGLCFLKRRHIPTSR